MKRLAAPMLLLAICIGFYWKLLLTNQYTWLSSPDIINQVMPWLQAESRQWQHHIFPLWDPHNQMGIPFVGQVQPGALNPFNWILFSIPQPAGFIPMIVFHWYYVLLHFCAALSCYLLCRDLKRSLPASILAGCAYGLGGYMGTNGFPQMMWPAVWLPLVLMFLLRAFSRRRPVAAAALSGAALGLSIWGGHHNVPTFTAVVTSAFWIYYVIAFWAARRWRALVTPAAFFVCLLLVSAVQTLPSQEFARLTLRWVGAPTPLTWDQTVPYSVHTDLTQPPSTILGIVIPGFQNNVSVLCGVTIFSFALIGLWQEWRRRTVRLLGIFALAGLALALGANSFFHGVLYAVLPLLEKARTAHMASALFDVGAVALAAFGLDWFQRANKNARIAATKWMVRAAAAIIIFLGAVLVVASTVRHENSQEYYFLALTVLASVLLLALLTLWKRELISNRVASALAISLVLVELNPMSTGFVARGDAQLLNRVYQHADIAAFLKSRPEMVRVEAYDEKELPYNFGDFYDIDQLDGDVPTMMLENDRAIATPALRPFLSANYAIAPKPTRPGQREVFKSVSGLSVFQNPDALPRARTESACSGNEVRITRYEPMYVEIDAAMNCPGAVILADTWYPGWQAKVDTKPAAINRGSNSLRSVPVEGGHHRVTMIYRPTSVYLGASLSLVGLLIAGGLCFRGARPRRAAFTIV